MSSGRRRRRDTVHLDGGVGIDGDKTVEGRRRIIAKTKGGAIKILDRSR